MSADDYLLTYYTTTTYAFIRPRLTSARWLCTQQPRALCLAAMRPSPSSSASLHVGMKRGVTTCLVNPLPLR